MKHRINGYPVRSFALLLLISVASSSGVSAQNAAPAHVVPLSPAEVLKLMPHASAPWTMTGSTASNSFSDWLRSSAVRTFEYAPAASGDAPEAPLQTTRLTLTDTGYFPQFMAEFAAFRPGRENDVEKFTIGSFPAIRITRGPVEILTVLINGRFVLQVRTDNQPSRATETWFKQFDVAKIPDRSAGDAKIPQPVTITRIDELDPAKSSSYAMSWASEEQQQRAAVDAEAEEKARKERR